MSSPMDITRIDFIFRTYISLGIYNKDTTDGIVLSTVTLSYLLGVLCLILSGR